MIHDLEFVKTNGFHIRGRMYIPEGTGPFPTVVFSHGFGGKFAELEHYGFRFQDRGIACVLFDFCGGGPESVSDGTMLEMSVLTESNDLLTVFEEIRKFDRVDCNNMFLMGESQGGYVSAYTAAQIPDEVKGLILWYPALIIGDDALKRTDENGNPVVSSQFGLPVGIPYTRDALSVDIYREIPKYKKEVLIIHGDSDVVVPLSYSQKAAGVYDNAEICVIEGAGHGFDGKDSEMAGNMSADFILKISGLK